MQSVLISIHKQFSPVEIMQNKMGWRIVFNFSYPMINPDLKADVVVANILAGPLKELYPIISQPVKESGDLGLSGILETQAESVCDAYTQSFDLDPVAVKEEWCRITGKLKLA